MGEMASYWNGLTLNPKILFILILYPFYVFLYLLVNIEDLNHWQIPSKCPLLPEGLSNE